MRRVGLIVDGQSEYRSLPLITGKFGASDLEILNPLYAPIQPLAPPGVIVRACRSRIYQLIQRRATDIVVILDRETRQECPGAWAEQITRLLNLPKGCNGWVVIKDKMFENWLISDIEALKASPRRYELSASFERGVIPNKADNCDALKMLKTITRPQYSKTEDSRIILTRAEPLRIAANSRSFRRFLRVIGSEPYKDQSIKAINKDSS